MIADMPERLVSPITVGRGDELQVATRALTAALDGHPVHLLIAGEAGVGKTRFVSEIAATAAELGMRVVSGGCANIGQGGLPYGALVEALRGVASELDPDELAAAVGPAAADLARLAPDIAPRLATGPDTDPALEPWQQARLMESLLGFLGRLAATAPVLLAIEDVHWADPATRETLTFLVRSLRTERVLVVMTFRADELHRRHPLLPWLAELERTAASSASTWPGSTKTGPASSSRRSSGLSRPLASSDRFTADPTATRSSPKSSSRPAATATAAGGRARSRRS